MKNITMNYKTMNFIRWVWVLGKDKKNCDGFMINDVFCVAD